VCVRSVTVLYFVLCNWIGCMICKKLFYLWIGPDCGSWSPWVKGRENKKKHGAGGVGWGCIGVEGTLCSCVLFDCRWLFFFSIIILKSRKHLDSVHLPYGGRLREQTRKNSQTPPTSLYRQRSSWLKSMNEKVHEYQIWTETEKKNLRFLTPPAPFFSQLHYPNSKNPKRFFNLIYKKNYYLCVFWSYNY